MFEKVDGFISNCENVDDDRIGDGDYCEPVLVLDGSDVDTVNEVVVGVVVFVVVILSVGILQKVFWRLEYCLYSGQFDFELSTFNDLLRKHAVSMNTQSYFV